ncbi:MAG: nucleotidyltransferase family protein [Opitutaceae bacterium]|jgi:predicted nucleotidyltransferase|nr:nucleotidyltransferase family protein [Opitutaceae bacterium]
MKSTRHNNEDLARLRELWPAMKTFGVEYAGVFGSRSRGEAGTESDWDILVSFKEPPSFEGFMNLKLMLEERLGARVDLVSRTACRPRFMESIREDLLNVA